MPAARSVSPRRECPSAAREKHPWSAADGKYCFHLVAIEPIANSNFMYRTDWLAKLGKQPPRTSEDFEALMKDLRGDCGDAWAGPGDRSHRTASVQHGGHAGGANGAAPERSTQGTGCAGGGDADDVGLLEPAGGA